MMVLTPFTRLFPKP